MLGFGCIVGLAIIEVSMRVFHLSAPLQYEPHPLYGWGHIRETVEWRRGEGEEIESRINAQGLRDVEHSYAKPKGVRRILILGDSFSEALQVPLEESYPRLLESMLHAETRGAGFRFEIVNSGTSGYGTDNELLFFRDEGSKYSPDIVVLQFCLCNDVRNNWHELDQVDSGGARKPYFVPGADGLILKNYPFRGQEGLLTAIKQFLNAHIRLYPFLREGRDRLMSSQAAGGTGIPLDFNVFEKNYSEPWQKAWQVTAGLLSQLKQDVEAQGARLVVVIVPTRFQVTEKDWRRVLQTYPAMARFEWDLEKPNRLLRGILEKEGIVYLDLLPQFQVYAQNHQEDLYLESDGHWNREGHRLAAKLLAEDLIHRGFVRRSDFVDPT